ncbi:MAG TPA: sigma-70 family RNA polymerase sigma factor [Burkholderiales bacterium]|nr:sigma-70 family RNA polymerase sigma factor [Burkholderiales bacterium]
MDQAAFEMAVRAYSSDLFRFAYWLCRNRWQAQDLVQEAFAAAWKARNALREPGAIKTWLFTILRNEHVRVHQRRQLPMEDVELDELNSPASGNPSEKVELDALLRTLPENYREPLVLQVLGGFSCREIAEMMNITEQNVMTRLTRSRQMLQRMSTPTPQAVPAREKG